MKDFTSIGTRVKLFKYIFLSGGVCILLGILGVVYIKKVPNMQSSIKRFSKKNIPTLAKDFTLSISSLVFEGTSKDLVPYKISADNAVKTIDSKYILNSIKGIYTFVDGKLTIKAKSGILDQSTKFITLKNDVRINLKGATIASQEINFNLDSKDAYSDKNVKATFKQSSITADKFEIKDSCGQIKFEGNVQSNFIIKSFN